MQWHQRNPSCPMCFRRLELEDKDAQSLLDCLSEPRSRTNASDFHRTFRIRGLHTRARTMSLPPQTTTTTTNSRGGLSGYFRKLFRNRSNSNS
mmetsp:Transcript_7400/g.13687  ORF Transcript_7400/g.13687 Transcript_7400/m.13687 type:complete len:93 (-) Transcript_7400:770-1048(-)